MFAILHIDDDPLDRLVTKRHASRLSGHVVLHQAEDLEQAKELLGLHSIDLVLLDIRLVRHQGLETIVELREFAPDVRVVAITGLCTPKMVETAIPYQVSEWISKEDISIDLFRRLICEAGFELEEPADGAGDETSVLSEATTEENGPSGQAESDLDGTPASVMIIDDEEADRFLMSRHIRMAVSEEVEIRTAHDGWDAMQQLCQLVDSGAEDSLPKLIFLDLNMPRKDGYQTLREIRAHEVLRHVPVVISTTSSSDREAVTAKEAGADDFLTKPSSLEECDSQIQYLKEHWFSRAGLLAAR